MITLDHPDDPLLDESFVPCRDDRCPVQELHAAHEIGSRQGRPPRKCPVCVGRVVNVPRKRTYCLDCSWQIVVNTKPRKPKRA